MNMACLSAASEYSSSLGGRHLPAVCSGEKRGKRGEGVESRGRREGKSRLGVGAASPAQPAKLDVPPKRGCVTHQTGLYEPDL